jgi:maltose/moltooligosaccharide transporter
VALSLLLAILSFFFIIDKQTLLIFTLIGSVLYVLGGLGFATLTMKLFPAEKFGQLSAGVNIFGCGILIVGNFAAGIFMDFAHSNYRMAYLWSAIGGLAIIPLLWVYRDWKNHGGPENYVAPLPPE